MVLARSKGTSTVALYVATLLILVYNIMIVTFDISCSRLFFKVVDIIYLLLSCAVMKWCVWNVYKPQHKHNTNATQLTAR